MPLTFDSLSHGSIAFGFFNIESDMLLCDHYFLFADEFCHYVIDLVEHADEPLQRVVWKVWYIETAAAIGDLMGAIHGVRFTGFIGALYRCFPFPSQPQDFKQNPLGWQTKSQVSDLIANYAKPIEIAIVLERSGHEIQIGDYRFHRRQFQRLIDYVRRGGYPRWQDDIMPDYVSTMCRQIMRHPKGIFKGISFSCEGAVQ